MPNKARKAGARNERAIASIMGGKRTPQPLQASLGGMLPDVQHERFSIECKHRASLPEWIKGALEQARRAARGEQLPIAVLHQSGQRHSEDLVVIHLSDFVEHFGYDPAEGVAE